jgi:hypothetical protein
MSKYRLYNFDASFRRDQNYFDYNLFANPLNPTNVTPVVLVNNSPHAYYSGRHMYDFGFTLLPQHRFSLDLDYNRNHVTGPSLQRSRGHGRTAFSAFGQHPRRIPYRRELAREPEDNC